LLSASQEPHRFGSLCTSTQLPPHITSGEAHCTPQVPALQAATPPDCSHFCPQSPQLLGSARVSTQVLPQRVYPSWQSKLQRPAAHDTIPFAGAVQVERQPPQFAGSALMSTHFPPQFVSFSPQNTTF